VDIRGWNERYQKEAHAAQDIDRLPTKLVVETAGTLAGGTALDLACGTGRNALWLAGHGWDVLAIDGSVVAVETLRNRARSEGLELSTQVTDLQNHSFSLPEAQWDLVTICYYLQRDLIEKAKRAAKPGGLLIVIVHITEGDEEPTQSRLRPGELENYFEGWEILHRYEGKPDDPAHKRSVAEIVARRAE
jgi:tellurite methyltransferase